MLSTIAEIIRELLIFVAVIAALLVALVVIVSTMPDRNPLKRLLTALSYRLGATLAAGAVAIPLEPIPGIDTLYDFGVPIVLIWYWFTFFRDARHMMCSGRESGGCERMVPHHDCIYNKERDLRPPCDPEPFSKRQLHQIHRADLPCRGPHASYFGGTTGSADTDQS